jgi:GNAT superfamily N-acetyltransferase
VELRRATLQDLPDVLAVLDAAAGWLQGRGVKQWPERFQPDWLRPDLAGGRTWLAYDDGVTVGTITITRNDPLWDDDRKALYVHRMAVQRSASGLGGELLRWAAEQAAEQGRDRLRLDCVAHNQRLRRYYQERGFAHRGDVEVRGAPGQRAAVGTVTVVSRYELPISPPGEEGELL